MKSLSKNAFKYYDCKENFLIPGVVDSQVYFNDPGYIHREDFSTGTKAAVKGGVTTIIDMPSTNVPALKNVSLLESKLEIVKNKAYCDYAFFGGMTSEEVEKKQFTDVFELMEAGTCGIEVYMNTTVASYKHLDNGHLLHVMQKFSDTGFIIIIHAEDFNICDYNTKIFKLKNKNYPKAWAEARPDIAEEISVNNALIMAKEFNVKLHFVNISCEKAVLSIQKAKENGLDVTCETHPAYLQFNEEDINKFGNISKLTPPLRKKHDNVALWRAINDGTIDMIGSSHCPYEYNTEKEFDGSNIWNVYSGTPEIEYLLLYLFSEGYLKHKISLDKLIEILCKNPAKRFGLYPIKGSIKVGAHADFVIINKNETFTVKKDEMYSKAKYTLFDHSKFNCRIENTFLRGEKVYDINDGISSENPLGEFIKRRYL